MEVVHTRCAGLDISKKDAKVCVRVAGAGPERAKKRALHQLEAMGYHVTLSKAS